MSFIVIRLKKYLDIKGIKTSVAEAKIGVSNGSLSKPFALNTTIQTDKLEKFLTVYNDINPDWLLTGEGNMIRDVSKNPVEKESIEKLSKYDLKLQIDAKDNLIALYKNKSDLNEVKLLNAFKNQGATINNAIKILEEKIEENIKTSQKLQEHIEDFFDYINLKDNIEIAKKRQNKKEENNNH